MENGHFYDRKRHGKIEPWNDTAKPIKKDNVESNIVVSAVGR